MKKSTVVPEWTDFDDISITKDNINDGNKPFTLRFYNKNVYCPKNTPNTTVCEMSVSMVWNIPVEIFTRLTECEWNTDFKVKGVAICHEDDDFDPEIGSLIASSKAENYAYTEAARRLTLMLVQLERMCKACQIAMCKMVKYNQHNIDFINHIVNYGIK